jgi:very-short-patch-repair endonuclease
MTHQTAHLAVDARIAAVAARQHGVVSRVQLYEIGLTPSQFKRRVGSGRLHRLHRGVYAVGHRVVGREGRWLAAVLACGPDAALSHMSAAALWGLRPSTAAAIDVTAARSRKRVDGIRMHRPRGLDHTHVTSVSRIRVTTVARTLVDLAGVLSPRQLKRAVHEAEVLRLLDTAAVIETTNRCRGRRGTARLRALIQTEAPPTRSELENRFLELVERHRFEPPSVNVQLLGMEVDFVWTERHAVVEVDGFATHATRRQFERDRQRDALLNGAGYTVLRLSWRQVTTEAAEALAALRVLLR